MNFKADAEAIMARPQVPQASAPRPINKCQWPLECVSGGIPLFPREKETSASIQNFIQSSEVLKEKRKSSSEKASSNSFHALTVNVNIARHVSVVISNYMIDLASEKHKNAF